MNVESSRLSSRPPPFFRDASGTTQNSKTGNTKENAAIFIDHGADPDARDEDLRSIWNAAPSRTCPTTRRGHNEIVQLLTPRPRAVEAGPRG